MDHRYPPPWNPASIALFALIAVLVALAVVYEVLDLLVIDFGP